MKGKLSKSARVTADSPEGQRATETFREQYDKANITARDAQFLDGNPEFAAYLLASIRCFLTKTPGYELVRTILGEDFISPEDVMKSCKDIIYTKKQIVKFRETVPAQEILEWCHDNEYMVVAGPNRPMSLLDIRSIKNDYFLKEKDRLYTTETFYLEDKVETKWYMIRKIPMLDLSSKQREQQMKILSGIEVIPNSAEFIWALIIYKEIRNISLFEGTYIRTSSHDAFCTPVKVLFLKGKIDIFTFFLTFRIRASRFIDRHDITPELLVGYIR